VRRLGHTYKIDISRALPRHPWSTQIGEEPRHRGSGSTKWQHFNALMGRASVLSNVMEA